MLGEGNLQAWFRSGHNERPASPDHHSHTDDGGRTPLELQAPNISVIDVQGAVASKIAYRPSVRVWGPARCDPFDQASPVSENEQNYRLARKTAIRSLAYQEIIDLIPKKSHLWCVVEPHAWIAKLCV